MVVFLTEPFEGGRTMSKLINAAIATLCFLVIAASQNSNFYRGSAQPRLAISDRASVPIQ
jgi:hypothetical protein